MTSRAGYMEEYSYIVNFNQQSSGRHGLGIDASWPNIPIPVSPESPFKLYEPSPFFPSYPGMFDSPYSLMAGEPEPCERNPTSQSLPWDPVNHDLGDQYQNLSAFLEESEFEPSSGSLSTESSVPTSPINYIYHSDPTEQGNWFDFPLLEPGFDLSQPFVLADQTQETTEEAHCNNVILPAPTPSNSPISFEDFLIFSPEPELESSTGPQVAATGNPHGPKKKGNNHRGRKGMPRCLTCRKWKRRCIYSAMDSACGLCIKKGWPHLCHKTLGPKASYKYLMTSDGQVVLR